MPTDYLKPQIDAFWVWFQENEKFFRTNDVPAEIVETLNNHILGFGLFSWQIGDGASKSRFLTISPNSNPQRLVISKQIIASAPYFKHWEFNYCKPAKDWDFVFEMYDSFMVLQEIDASDWEFALFPKSSGMVEIRIQVKHPSLIDFEDKKAAAELVVTNILGEEKRIDYVENLIVVSGFIPDHQSHSAFIPKLKKHFKRLI